MEERNRGAVIRFVACLGAGLLAATAFGQPAPEVPAMVPRVSGPVVEAVALEGDRLSGCAESVGRFGGSAALERLRFQPNRRSR